MVRYEKGHKAATKERIMEVAARRFRDEGIEAVGLAGVMSDAGLTNGAFYAHFDSKEGLVKEVLEKKLEDQKTAIAATADEGGLEQVIREYLTSQHRDQAGEGCPSAALLEEIARRPQATRDAYTARLGAVMDVVAGYLKRDDPEQARVDAFVIFGSLLGALQLSRAVSDPVLSAQILENGIAAAMRLAAG